MEASQAEKVSQLARSLYNNRLAGSMDDAYKMAESILSRSATGESRSLKDMADGAMMSSTPMEAAGMAMEEDHVPQDVKSMDDAKKSTDGPAPKASAKEAEGACPIAHGDLAKIEALKQVILEEEGRIASLKKELADLKAGIGDSGSVVAGATDEIESLAKDIDSAKKDIAEIHEHMRDLQDIKREVKEIDEAQCSQDEVIEQAGELKERTQEWTPLPD